MNTPFNPAFVNVTNFSTRAVKALGHQDDIDHQPRQHPMAARLRAAADAFADQQRRQPWKDFLNGKAATCNDMADKLDRFGSFVSERQEEFARKLIDWSGVEKAAQTRQEAPQAPIAAPVAPTPAPAPVVRLERLFELMQRLSKLTIGDLTIARKNGDSLCWVKHAQAPQVVGKIEGGVLTLWSGRLAQAGLNSHLIEQALLAIEADPEAAAVLHGKASGQCAICSRDLTDPVSIERGIGPICVEKAGW